MKKILFSAMISSFGILIACNDGSSSNSSNMDSATTAPVPATSNDAVDNSIVKKTLTMSSAQEVPANTSSATGSADVTYNKTSHMLTYTINWSGLTGNATMAHIHGTAPKGTNAGVKRDLTGMLQKATSGTFTDSVMVDGNTIKEDSLLTGFYYFNIHTAAHPGGEIRAQIEL